MCRGIEYASKVGLELIYYQIDFFGHFKNNFFTFFFSNANKIRCPKFTVWHPADLKREESGDKESIIKRHIYSGARLGQIWALVSRTIK